MDLCFAKLVSRLLDRRFRRALEKAGSSEIQNCGVLLFCDLVDLGDLYGFQQLQDLQFSAAGSTETMSAAWPGVISPISSASLFA
jgi:hypothetical protein